MPLSHELYNVGHLYEAAVAWYRVTGRDDFLTVARKSAYLVGNAFGPGEFQLKDDTGHEEIELALCKLYQVTGEAKHLALAKWFVDVKGREAARAERPLCADRAVERDGGRRCGERAGDNGGKAYDAVLSADASFADDVVTIGDKAYPALKASTGLKLIPYCLWGNREPGNDMQVWFRDGNLQLQTLLFD